MSEGDGSPVAGSPVASRAGPEGTPATDSIVLEEEIDPNYVPSDEEGMIYLYTYIWIYILTYEFTFLLMKRVCMHCLENV
jgi:hypothetical protein